MKKLIVNLYNKYKIDKPEFLPLEEWDVWHAKTRAAHPIPYLLFETIPTKFTNFIEFFSNRYYDAKYWIKYSFFDKSYIINTNLKKGEYHDPKDRILHGLFTLLVDFVELEHAYMYVRFSSEDVKSYKFPWWSKGVFRIKDYRCPQAGIAHLKWEMTLDGPNIPLSEQSPHQANRAREIWILYHWWKYIRPTRQEPGDASGWSEYLKEKYSDSISSYLLSTSDQRSKELLAATTEIELAYEQEDEEMLIRLIKIRDSLWT